MPEKIRQIRKLLAGKFVILTEKMKYIIEEICHTGGKFGQTGGTFRLACCLQRTECSEFGLEPGTVHTISESTNHLDKEPLLCM